MLQTMRDNSQGIVAKILVGFIIVVFALWGVDSLVGLATAEPPPAEVNGVEVTQQELARGIELQRRQVLTQMGENADPQLLDENRIRASVLQSLIDRTLRMERAQSSGLYVSDAMLDQLIVATPEFQIDGRFDRNQFEAVLRSAGYTPLSYRRLLTEETLIAQERRAFQNSAFITSAELDRLLELNAQTRDLNFVEIRPDFEAVEVSDTEIQALYEERADQLRSPEQLIVEYILLDRAEFADPDAVSQAEINGAYDALVAGFEAQEERAVRHILFEGSEALAQAEEARALLVAGESFEQLAAELSVDIGSAEQGGDLGYITSGVFEGAFEDAVFSLTTGELSEPVETEFGVHLIRVDEIRSTQAPTLEEVEGQLREQLALENAEQDYVVALERLADLTFSSGDLTAASEELGVAVQTSEPFSRSSAEGLFANSRVLNAAYSETVLEEQINSDPIELDAGRTLVMHLKERIPERALDLQEVADQLRSELERQKATAEARSEAEALLAQVKSGSTTPEWASVEGIARGASSELDPRVIEAAFEMPGPDQGLAYRLVELFDGSFVVLTVTSIGQSEEALSEEERQSILQFLADRRGALSYEAQHQAYRDVSRIEVN